MSLSSFGENDSSCAFGRAFNQLIASALGEKIAALKTVEFLRERAQGADEKDWEEILALVTDVEPESFDQLLSAPRS